MSYNIKVFYQLLITINNIEKILFKKIKLAHLNKCGKGMSVINKINLQTLW